MKITQLSIKQLQEQFETRQLSAEEVTGAYLEAITQKDGEIGAYLTVCDEKALAAATEIDRKRASGEAVGPLAGIPAGIKDNISTKGVRTSCGSRMLENYIPPYDATVVERLQGAGTVVLGKMNMDEFAMGSTNENSYFKPVKNPVDTTRVPGGSSGGSAAAVASGQALFTLGSDTGGSIRQPASFCGVVGMKPTYGAVSRYGLIAFASSLDQIGPLTRTVEDMATVMNTLVGHDAKDSTSAPVQWGDFTEALVPDVKGLRIALPKEYFGEGIHPEVKEAVLAAARKYESMGAKVSEVSLSTMDYALPAYYLISSAEASSNLARFDGIQYGFRAEGYEELSELYSQTRNQGFGKEVKRRILLGTYALSSGYYDAYYKKAQQVRGLIQKEYAAIYKNHDVILSPVAPTTAYKLGEKSSDPLEMYMGDIYTVPVNIAGVPAVSLNCGHDKSGLPIGMQLIGKAFDEKTLIRAAYAYEQATAKRKGE